MKLSLSAAVALAITLTAVLPTQAGAHGHRHKPSAPDVPASIQVPAGHRVSFVGHAVGTQDYICLPTATGYAWTLFTPQATLFNAGDRQLTTHFLSPNPQENGTPRPTWQDSRDSSAVWASAFPPSFDPQYVAPGALPWLLLQVVGKQDGPNEGDRLSATKYIQRVNTEGGIAPVAGCGYAANVGAKVFVPYRADYYFFERAGRYEE